MKLSALVTISDLLPHKKRYHDKIIFDRLSNDLKKIFTLNTPEYVFSTFKKAGVDGMELMVNAHTSDKEIETIRSMVTAHNLTINSIHQSLSSFLFIRLPEIKRLFATAQKLDAKVIVLHIDAIGRRLTQKSFIETIHSLEKEYAIKVGIENMPVTPFNLIRRYAWKDKSFSRVIEKGGYSITLDTTHLGQTGGDLLSFYRAHKEKIVNIHFSDYKKNWKNKRLMLTTDTHLPPGKGNLPLPGFLKLLKKEGYKGLITMEIDTHLDGLCKSADMIKKVWK